LYFNTLRMLFTVLERSIGRANAKGPHIPIQWKLDAKPIRKPKIKKEVIYYTK
jgi:hypothetical protein